MHISIRDRVIEWQGAQWSGYHLTHMTHFLIHTSCMTDTLSKLTDSDAGQHKVSLQREGEKAKDEIP